ncbi:MAG: oligosaccharide flippase family protein [Cytophagales bacterium]|nr:oligosaccharide flippase family protein [Armatimonadota bacterium]
MTNSRLVGRNFLASLLTQLLSWALTFSVTLFLPRYAGVNGMGELALAGAFVAIFAVLAPLGTSSVMIKEIARDSSRAGELLGASLAVRIPLATALSGIAFAATSLLGYSAELKILILVSAIGMVIGTINDALGAVLQGMENLTRQGIGVLADKLLLGILTILLIVLKQPLWTIAATGIVTATVSCAVNLFSLRAILPTLLRRPALSSSYRLVAMGVPFIGLSLFTTLYGQSDALILSLVSNSQTVGWYAIALRLVGTTMFLPVAINAALIPTLSRLYVSDKEQFVSTATRILVLIAVCGVPVASILLFSAPAIIQLLHYPAEFNGSIPVLRVGGAAALAYYFTIFMGAVITASDRQAQMLPIFAKSCLIGIPGCFLFSYLCDRYLQNGAFGAILSHVLMEIYVFTFLFRILSDVFSFRFLLRLMGRLLIAVTPMGALLLWLTSSRSPITPIVGLWAIVPGVLLYIMGCILLRCVNGNEFMTLLRGVMSRRTPAL